jgi:DNA-binding CsgD family transcriptional regulator
MALDALRDGTLLDAALESTAYHRCVGVLIMADAIDEARDAIAALRYRASTTFEWFQSELALRTGDLAGAERHAREALEAAGDAGGAFVGAHRVLASALAQRGAFDEAHQVLGWLPADSTALLRARARVALAEGRFQQAYDDACATGTRNARHGRPNPTWDGWRSTAALALAHLGRRQEAAALAETELSEATAFGATVPIARARVARAVAERDDRARVTSCQDALGHLSDHPALLETIRLRLELGGALARTGRRLEAREPLRHALADADRSGALLLAQRARRELVATGLRPRRAAIDGPGALTPRQRQICELAAAGKANRAIAGELFLSLKTVETHLAAAYRKLGVRGRADLAGSL